MSEKTLPERMYEAAAILEEATARYTKDWAKRSHVEPELFDWRPANLTYIADMFEAEDKQNRTFRELTADLFRLEDSGLAFEDRARDLLLSYDITPKEL